MIEQHLQNIESHQTAISDEIQAIRDFIRPEISVTATRKDNHILVEWTGEIEDIQFSISDGKFHSVQDMRETLEPPPPPIEGHSYKIGRADNINEKWVIIVSNKDDSAKVILEAVEESPPNRTVPIGIWDPLETDINFDIGFAASPNRKHTAPVLERYDKIIPILGGFQNGVDLTANDSIVEHQLRQKVRNRVAQFEEIGWDRIFCVNLQDEPGFDGLTEKHLRWIVDEANKRYPVPSTFSFTVGSVLDHDFPDNIPLVWFNGYPFFTKDAKEGYSRIFTKTEFMNHFKSVIDRIHEKIPGVEIMISPQGFYNGGERGNPWRKPPLESVDWYIELAEKHNLKALMIWQYKNLKNWICLEGIPDLQQAWVDALKKST